MICCRRFLTRTICHRCGFDENMSKGTRVKREAISWLSIEDNVFFIVLSLPDSIILSRHHCLLFTFFYPTWFHFGAVYFYFALILYTYSGFTGFLTTPSGFFSFALSFPFRFRILAPLLWKEGFEVFSVVYGRAADLCKWPIFKLANRGFRSYCLYHMQCSTPVFFSSTCLFWCIDSSHF